MIAHRINTGRSRGRFLPLCLLFVSVLLIMAAGALRPARADGPTTVLVSADANGRPANQASSQPVISADGRFVAFTSKATNLVPGDTNRQSDIFLHDRQTGVTSRVSLTAGGAQATGGASTAPRIAADGHSVAFLSKAKNLIPGLNPGAVGQIYVRVLGE